MNPKQTLVNLLAYDNRIWRYNKEPSLENAKDCIQAYQEAVIEFCKKYDEQTKEEE